MPCANFDWNFQFVCGAYQLPRLKKKRSKKIERDVRKHKFNILRKLWFFFLTINKLQQIKGSLSFTFSLSWNFNGNSTQERMSQIANATASCCIAVAECVGLDCLVFFISLLFNFSLFLFITLLILHMLFFFFLLFSYLFSTPWFLHLWCNFSILNKFSNIIFVRMHIHPNTLIHLSNTIFSQRPMPLVLFLLLLFL